MQKSHKTKSNGISLTTSVMFLAIILLVVLGATRLNEVMEQKARLKAENIALQNEKQALKDELDQINKEANNLDSNVYIESIARTHLDMVYSDEIIFHVSDN